MIIQPNCPIPHYLLYTLPHQKKKNLICARSGRLILSEGFKKKKKRYTTCSQVQIFRGTPPPKREITKITKSEESA